MRAREFVTEDADGQQVLDYIHGTHHEPLTTQLQQAVLSHPRWELQSVPISSLHIPDQEYDDEEQEPEADPYNRVQVIDPDHAGEYSANFVDRRPIVVDREGWIIDGNHRAWAASELLNRSTIRAWVPVKQGVAEDAENFNGIGISMEVEGDEIMVRATAGGRELGHVLFVEDGEYLMPQDLEVEERFQGQGIAAAMYDYVKSKGYKIRRSGQQTDAGAGFWRKNRGEENVWENFADGRNPQDKGDSKRYGVPTKASVSTLRKVAKQGGRKGQLAHWMANMKAGRAKAKKK
jgi:hypothetical protein